MKSFLAIIALALLAIIPAAFADDHMDKAIDDMQPVKLVMFYSDTCGSCKILEPRIDEAMKSVNTNTLKVVKFDFSNKEKIAATRAIADENKVNPILQSYGAKTGFAVLVDAQGNETGTLTINHEVTDIAQELVKLIIER